MATYDGFDWAMEMCLDSGQEITRKRFPSKTEAVEWLRENQPSFFRPGVWTGEGVTWFQYGTDYHWAQFNLAPRPVASATLVPETDKGRPHDT